MFRIVVFAHGTQFLRQQKQVRRSKQFQSDLDNCVVQPHPWHTSYGQAPQGIPQHCKVATKKSCQGEKLGCVVSDTKDLIPTHYREQLNKFWGIYSGKYIEEEIILETQNGMSSKRFITKKIIE